MNILKELNISTKETEIQELVVKQREFFSAEIHCHWNTELMLLNC